MMALGWGMGRLPLGLLRLHRMGGSDADGWRVVKEKVTEGKGWHNTSHGGGSRGA